jgi:competence protein ComGC
MEDILNQTQFATQEPVLESQNQVLEAKNDKEAELPPKKNKMLIIGVIVMAVLIVILLLLVMFLPSRNKNSEMIKPSPTPVVMDDTEVSEYQLEVQQLKTDLETADPSLNDLAFPPVDLTFTLEE